MQADVCVVPSAPGKRFDKDTKVTDMLYACYALAAEGKDFGRETPCRSSSAIRRSLTDLELKLSLEKEFST